MHAASVILLSWAMIGAACLFPHFLASAVAGVLAVLVAVIGLPHGAADHRFARPRLEPFLGQAWLPVFLSGYLMIAAAVACGWFVAPATTILFFFMASACHFGLEERLPPVGPRWARPVVRLARGGLVIWIPILFHAEEVTRTLGMIAPTGSEPAIRQALLPLTACSWIMVAVAAVAWTVQGMVALGLVGSECSGRTRRVLLTDNLLVASLVLVFAIASPLVGFIVYFCGWHSARGLRRLRIQLGETWRQLAGSLAAPTAAAIAVCSLVAWFCRDGAAWNDTLVRATFVGLSAVAIPHLLLHALAPWLDAIMRRSALASRCGSPA
jgi:Brp/Blh family beta-carotene 15,15'-monooxygenase